MRPAAEIQALIRERTTLSPDAATAVIDKRFRELPRRLTAAMRHWPIAGLTVLDVGCSFGHCLVHFGPGSVGLDNVPEHVEFCRSLDLDARLCDVEQGLGMVEDGCFDVAWVSDVLEHLDAPRLLLRRIAPKLKADGRLIVFMTVLPRSRLSRRVFASRGWFDADVHHYQFTVETARYLLERCGYVVEEAQVHMLPGPLQPLNGLLAPLAPVIFLAARADEAAGARALAAERRNKPRPPRS
jgi:SAM-dependent methyltransferase